MRGNSPRGLFTKNQKRICLSFSRAFKSRQSLSHSPASTFRRWLCLLWLAFWFHAGILYVHAGTFGIIVAAKLSPGQMLQPTAANKQGSTPLKLAHLLTYHASENVKGQMTPACDTQDET